MIPIFICFIESLHDGFVYLFIYLFIIYLKTGSWYVAQAGPPICDLPASASQVLGLHSGGFFNWSWGQAPHHLSHGSSSFFCFFSQGPVLGHDPSTCASHVAGITIVPATPSLFMEMGVSADLKP
jgi:hypothetical protein